MLSRRVLPGACRVLPVLIAAVGTLEYLAIDLPHLGRSLVFLYVASAVLLLNQRYPLASPLAALGVLVVFSLVDPLAATEGNTTLLLAMFSLFVVAAFNPGRVAVLGGLFGLACLAVVALRAPVWDVSGLVVLVLLLLIAWGAGRLSALRDQIARDLRDQTQRAETERAEEAARAVELERARISRELHDIVAHHISVIVVQARGGRRCLTTAPEDARQAFDAIEQMGGEALTEMRQLLGVLSDQAHAPLSPSASLRQLDPLLNQLRSTGQEVDLVVQGTAVPLPPGTGPGRVPDRAGVADQRRQAHPSDPRPRDGLATGPPTSSWRSPTTDPAPIPRRPPTATRRAGCWGCVSGSPSTAAPSARPTPPARDSW